VKSVLKLAYNFNNNPYCILLNSHPQCLHLKYLTVKIFMLLLKSGFPLVRLATKRERENDHVSMRSLIIFPQESFPVRLVSGKS